MPASCIETSASQHFPSLPPYYPVLCCCGWCRLLPALLCKVIGGGSSIRGSLLLIDYFPRKFPLNISRVLRRCRAMAEGALWPSWVGSVKRWAARNLRMAGVHAYRCHLIRPVPSKGNSVIGGDSSFVSGRLFLHDRVAMCAGQNFRCVYGESLAHDLGRS